MAMNSTELSKVVQGKLKELEIEKTVSKLNQKETRQLLDAVLEAIVESTVETGEVSLQGFGKFLVRERAPRTGRNPQTGDPIDIPASKSPAFKPVKAFKEAVK